jgi:outer membrane receptor for Fe3+-dicitrate
MSSHITYTDETGIYVDDTLEKGECVFCLTVRFLKLQWHRNNICWRNNQNLRTARKQLQYNLESQLCFRKCSPVNVDLWFACQITY